MSGMSHFTAKVVGYAAAAGVPLPSLAVPASGVIAVAGALSILLGYHARIGAWLLVLFLVPVTLIMHNFWAVKDPMMAQLQMVMFMKNLSMLGGALLISQFGAGPWSLDARQSELPPPIRTRRCSSCRAGPARLTGPRLPPWPPTALPDGARTMDARRAVR
jgi:putative oxidoreductase